LCFLGIRRDSWFWRGTRSSHRAPPRPVLRRDERVRFVRLKWHRTVYAGMRDRNTLPANALAIKALSAAALALSNEIMVRLVDGARGTEHQRGNKRVDGHRRRGDAEGAAQAENERHRAAIAFEEGRLHLPSRVHSPPGARQPRSGQERFAGMLAMTRARRGGTMSPEELKLKIEELRTLIIEKIAELEDDAQWGDAEEREELADELEELAEQAHILRDLLQQEE